MSCTPPEPVGVEVGSGALDVQISPCEGAPAGLHDLCGAASVVVNWYGWCPSCEGNAALVRALADTYPSLNAVVVLDEDPLADPVDIEFCALYAEEYPSSAALWMDPEGRMEVYGATDLVLVLDDAGVVRFVEETSNEATIVQAVEAVL